jgi:hypothetical protein
MASSKQTLTTPDEDFWHKRFPAAAPTRPLRERRDSFVSRSQQTSDSDEKWAIASLLPPWIKLRSEEFSTPRQLPFSCATMSPAILTINNAMKFRSESAST